VPVVVDAAAEYGWRDMLATGADLVLFSAQKALGGPTAGVIAGKRHLVRAAYAQSRGIARPMKAGKEAVVGTIAALRRWMALDHAGIRQTVEGSAEHVARRLSGIAGMTALVVPDESGNPFSRVHLTIDGARAGFSAHGLDAELWRRRPRLVLRSLQADRGILQIDVRRLDVAGLDDLCDRILAAIDAARRDGATASPQPPADRSAAAVLDWLDEV
jgi:L-seryl-tRNA(Ser) seleniumtransferase